MGPQPALILSEPGLSDRVAEAAASGTFSAASFGGVGSGTSGGSGRGLGDLLGGLLRRRQPSIGQVGRRLGDLLGGLLGGGKR